MSTNDTLRGLLLEAKELLGLPLGKQTDEFIARIDAALDAIERRFQRDIAEMASRGRREVFSAGSVTFSADFIEVRDSDGRLCYRVGRL